MPLELVPLQLVHPLALQLYAPPLVKSTPKSSLESSSIGDQSQSNPEAIAVEDDESSSSKQTVHQEPLVVEDFNKAFDDALNVDIKVVIDGMTKMALLEELTTHAPSMKVKKVATKKATS